MARSVIGKANITGSQGLVGSELNVHENPPENAPSRSDKRDQQKHGTPANMSDSRGTILRLFGP
jgi:hypothetical protein